ncbi:MAG: response regulator [Candidatus Anammoxibacter sp.]
MSNGNVLVVDDEDLMCDLIEQVLTMKDYSITTMISSTEALEEIKQKKDYDIIVADIRMPKVSGIDLLRASNEQNMNYQFILITGFYNLLAPDALESLKPFAFLKKPFDINLLVKTVDEAVQKKRELDSGKSE